MPATETSEMQPKSALLAIFIRARSLSRSSSAGLCENSSRERRRGPSAPGERRVCESGSARGIIRLPARNFRLPPKCANMRKRQAKRQKYRRRRRRVPETTADCNYGANGRAFCAYLGREELREGVESVHFIATSSNIDLDMKGRRG